MKINILPKEIFNLIAAGEVVERPASVIKELIENSIDAKASDISIYIENGGLKSMKIIDNGTGIEKSEIPKVLLPHSTSKINSIEDLSKIGTLGFRGEALASISAVSDIIITTKTIDDELGTMLTQIQDLPIKIEECGASTGTTVEVLNLFKNIPARAKFLKKPKSEEQEITNLVARYILANPNISFKYMADNKLIYQSYGRGKQDSIFSIYGKETISNLIAIDRKFKDIHIHGYIGKPSFSKPNRTYQTLVLNGRYIQNQVIQTAITNAYGDFLMKRQYPFYVIFIEMPLSDVDVNVHPNKMEVRFSNNINLYPLIFETVVRGLHQLDSEPHTLNIEQTTNEVIKDNNVQNKEVFKEDNNHAFDNYWNSMQLLYNKESIAQGPNTIMQNIDLKTGEVVFNDHIQQANDNKNIKQAKFAFDIQHRIIGKLFNTYLIIEQGDEAYFIDQHAMHERLLYDKLKEEIENNEITIQPMLIPHIFAVNSLEQNFLEEHKNEFKALGFEIDSFGDNSYKLSSIPSICSDISINEFMSSVLSDIKNFTINTTSEIIKDKLATKACKVAVKAGNDLSDNEIEKLIQMINETNATLRCPHGRPAVIKLKKAEIEKWFKRIV